MAKFNVCPRCGASLRSTKALNGGNSTFWKECSNTFCGTMIDAFEPFGMQYNFMKDPHTIKGAFGGYGSGKSLGVIKDVEKHALITPGGHIAIIGFTYRVINRNFKKDFDEQFPVALVKASTGEKTPGFNAKDMIYTLKNGCKIELITADNVIKLRGLNATKIVLLEASNITYVIFEALKSRIRNMAASVPKLNAKGQPMFELDQRTGEMVPLIEAEWQNITMESNPEGNWIQTEFLLKADRIQFYGSSYNKYQYLLDKINKDYSLHISATDVNPHLPKNYLEINTRGKPEHEVKRFYYGSFLFVSNMVHPKIHQALIDPYPINLNDPDIFVIIGYDYGLYDPSVFEFGAVNFKRHTVTYYDEIEVIDMSVKQIVEAFREKLSVIPDGKLLFLPKMDAKSYSKRGGDKVSLGSMFEDAGIIFDPIQEAPKERVIKTNSLIDNKQLFIFRTLKLAEELRTRARKVDSKGDPTDELIDKHNHRGDAMEFSLIKLPFNLEKMVLADYLKPGERVVADLKKKKEKPILTEQQKIVQAMNPFNFTQEKDYNEHDYNEEEYDTIISKLSGI